MSKKIATRQAFGQALEKLGEKYPEVVCFDADLSKSTMSKYFAKKYPSRFFEMGIQEANMIGAAAGMSFAGKIPFICSFAAFVTGRYDQIRMSIGYSAANVKIIGTHAGVGIGEDGHSQMGLEDLSLMRAIPNMTVLQPCTEEETYQMMEWAIKHHGPVYFRLTRQGLQQFDLPDFSLGNMPQLIKGTSKTAMIATGALVELAHQASSQKDQTYSVYNASTLKPLDNPKALSVLNKYERIFVLEDHSKIGGLGSALCELAAENTVQAQIIRYAVDDMFGESGTPGDLYKKHGFTVEQILQSLQ